MVRRLLLGLLKGLVVGGAIGATLHFALGVNALSEPQHWLGFLLYGIVALLAGVVAGQPPWRDGAWVASILKGLFGFGVGAGLYWLGWKFLPGGVPAIGAAAIPGAHLADAPLLFAPVVATVYATLVELDDGGEASSPTKKTGVRVSAKDALLEELSVEAERKAESASKAKR